MPLAWRAGAPSSIAAAACSMPGAAQLPLLSREALLDRRVGSGSGCALAAAAAALEMELLLLLLLLPRAASTYWGSAVACMPPAAGPTAGAPAARPGPACLSSSEERCPCGFQWPLLPPLLCLPSWPASPVCGCCCWPGACCRGKFWGQLAEALLLSMPNKDSALAALLCHDPARGCMGGPWFGDQRASSCS